jgi:hypothetical protein
MYWNKIYREELSKKYRAIFKKEEKPEWAVKKVVNSNEPIHPAIPFVGENYDKTRLIVYASAEYIKNYENGDGDFDNDKTSIYRRYNYINKDDEEQFFPELICAPISQLLIVSAYILECLKIKISYNDPYEFISYIAADNFGKFTRVNRKDYAGNITFLRYSFEYIKVDLRILKPKIIILPYRIYSFPEVKELIDSFSPSCMCLPIYQMNSHNINHKGRISGFPKRREEDIPKILLKWQKKITDKKIHKNFPSVYNYLDSILKEYKK